MYLKNSGRFVKDKTQNSKNFAEQREDPSELGFKKAHENDEIDHKYGFDRISDHLERTGFLLNMHTNEILDEDKRLISAVDYFFMQEDGTRFKATLPFSPYFYILAHKEAIQEVTQYLAKKYLGLISKIETVVKEDLDLPNHLIGLKQRYLKLSFKSMNDLIKVKREIMPTIRKNREYAKTNTYYTKMLAETLSNTDSKTTKKSHQLDNVIDIREYDVPYHVRVSIDKKIFCGSWYTVQGRGTEPPIITKRDDLIERPEPIVLAFDIETTKLPLKFPDAATDQIMMISYMIDGQGFLITNREIVSADVDDFEYTPRPELEGEFKVYNALNETQLLRHFFDHIINIRPHVFVTYNGDFFDWPFVEARAAIYGMNMATEIGVSKSNDGLYLCRPAIHMDCLCWVKRDSYLPVGSQNLKAVAKAKLRYDPVELDPEDMCALAVEKPQILSNYSVSDAVATYYLYMKYIHPFVFALCTIIPMEPDEVLRKGSGTLCETLLMVEAFHANIVFPNKQETEMTKWSTDGHILEQETYVGGHVEALESGVFRADIPCRFRLDPEGIDVLADNAEQTLRRAIEEEHKVPLNNVTNFEEAVSGVRSKLNELKKHPNRIEVPVIYHLDVGAMYPNIILTNRLQPSAIVDETVCASCDYNRSGARCQRNMEWMWRGDMLPATRGEYQRILQQLETEKFPSAFPGGQPRAFHQLSREDQTTNERSRLKEYCRKAYRKLKVTRTEERTTTICQMENSFYVDTVRAFRDRRYEYKGLSKKSKQEVNEAIKKGNAEEIRSAKNREVLYDSLQLAHKCILNSFYGYVMRRGARWHSMEMAGIVCHTGAHIIMKARQIIEQIGRPLELDTDGIWCVLPASFPETITIEREDGRPLEISYANAVLNAMVQDYFTNDQYHELIDAETLDYKVRSENSIFFEVDGPYRAMVLPASKEEGKKLKKRYAVFDFDGSLAELKGFEVKRRGELKLIKIFQGSVFGAFLKGSTLEECYDEVARVADYWLDVLYSRGANMPDSELFDLISENRSMSRKLEDYGAQKSTSISTAKRLAEFLGDQMVKDKGLACKFIISRKPDGAPVTERAIPLAIFQTELGTKRHFLRKWLKDSSLIDLDIRDVLDWNYYIERLGSTIQKIITIPAALQGIANPVPRIKHPPWLHKKILEKNDVFKQRSITEMFAKKPKQNEINIENIENTSDCPDIEDMGQSKSPKNKQPSLTVTKRKRSDDPENCDLTKNWREVLGPPPSMGKTRKELQAWIVYQKKKWKLQAQQRGHVANSKNKNKRARYNENTAPEGMGVVRSTTTLSGFLRKAQRSLLELPWQAIQISETREPGVMKLWVLVGQELHQLRITVPRVFYVNQRTERAERTGEVIRKCNRVLPRSRPVYNLYQVTLPENVYQEHSQRLLSDFSSPGMEGIYETQMSPLFRALMQLGCVCGVKREFVREMVTRGNVPNVFSLDQLSIRNLEAQPYLQSNDLRHIYLYHHKAASDQRAMFGLFLSPTKRAYVFVLDSVRTNQMPNMNNMYNIERNTKKERGKEEDLLPPSDITFEIRVETDPRQVFRLLQRTLLGYLNEKRGPSLIAIQSPLETDDLISNIPALTDLPNVEIHVQDIENLYGTLDWQRVGAKAMIRHYLNSESVLEILAAQCRYFYVPIGNVPSDPTIFSADLYFARYLQKHNFVLWCSPTEKPDLGGWEADDNRLLMDIEEGSSAVANKSGCYSTVCVELDIDGLAVNTLLQSHKIHDTEEASFNAPPSLDQLIGGVATTGPLPTYDETSPCAAAFKVLRSVVSAWLRDISVHRNVFADFQVVHFYRWLRSAKSLLYEPAIRRTLLGLMKKLFVQLIAELTRLGVTIVYADFNKIVLCTKKHTIEDAVAYVEFIVRSVRNKELFHSIELSYSQCWEYLVWLDAGNHAGVKGKLPSEEAEATEEEHDDKSQIIMNWSLTENLPEEGGCRASFNAVIAGFISAVHTHIYENVEGRTGTPLPRRPNTSMSMSMTQPLGLAAHSTAAEFAKELITGEMSMKLFEITQKIHARAPECKVPEGFPGAKSKTIRPALEFVKAVCHILSLDKSVTDEITSLRSNMLRLVGVGEFSDESVWVEPFISFVLPEVICNACNHCRDIDLIKDLNKSNEDDDKSVWLCTVCKTSYENDEIEYQLIDALNRKAMAYMLQDLQCTKCSQIKRENMPQYCSCAGTFQTLVSRQSILDHLNTFKMVAKSFKMPLLLETSEWFLQNTK